MPSTQPLDTFIIELTNALQVRYNSRMLAQQTAWWLLEKLTGTDQAQLIAQETISLTREQRAQLQAWIDALIIKHMPLQYLLGSVPFDDIEILVEPPVLIPRPETEQLATELSMALQQCPDQQLILLDIGTGSGCIAITLAHALPDAMIYATDIADHALDLAQRNATHNHVTNIRFVYSHVFASLPATLKFDCIVSNPPYIAPAEWRELDRSVTDWEDKKSLVAPDNGLAIIREIISQAAAWLKPNEHMAQLCLPQLVLEIGYTQAPAIVILLKDAGFSAVVKKDLEGKDRFIWARYEAPLVS